jgi:hypothetical protein
MTEHAVVIAGGGPTGLMLAAELALAALDDGDVERRASQDLGSRSAWNRRSVPIAGAGGSGRGVRLDRLRTSATFPPATTTASGCGRTTSRAYWPAGSASSGCRSIADAK